MKFKLKPIIQACALALAVAAAPAHAAEGGLFDRIKSWWNGTSESAPANSATGEMQGAQTVATEAQAKALCDDMQMQVKAAQDRAITDRLPPKSPAQVINDDYGVLDILNTPIDIGGLISGGLTGLMSDMTKKIAQSFVNSVVMKAQDAFKNGVNDTLRKYQAPAVFQGTVERAVAGVNGAAGTVFQGATNAGTDAIYGAGKAATSAVNSTASNIVRQAGETIQGGSAAPAPAQSPVPKNTLR